MCESGEGNRYTTATAAPTAMADQARTANTGHAYLCLTAATAYQLLAQEDVQRPAEDDHDRVGEGARSDVANPRHLRGGGAGDENTSASRPHANNTDHHPADLNIRAASSQSGIEKRRPPRGN